MNLQQAQILITGGTGHLGTALVHHLIQCGVPPHHLHVLYLPGSPTAGVQHIKGLNLLPANLLNPAQVQQACRNKQWVFHLAGSTSFNPQHKKLQWLINVEGTRHVLQACAQSGTVQKVCYTSTVNALALPHPNGSIGTEATCQPFTRPGLHSFKSRAETLQFIEHARRHPAANWHRQIGIGYYDSKLAAQVLVDETVETTGLPVVSVMPGTMFGPFDHLVGTGLYLLSIYRGQMPGVLKGGLPLAHVCNVAAGHLLAMQKGPVGEQYILSGPEEDNRYLKDMCAIIAQVLQQRFPNKKIRAPRLTIPTPIALAAATFSEGYAALTGRPALLSRSAVRPGSYAQFYSSQKAVAQLGYQPNLGFKQAVIDMLDYYIAHNLLNEEGRWIDRQPTKTT